MRLSRLVLTTALVFGIGMSAATAQTDYSDDGLTSCRPVSWSNYPILPDQCIDDQRKLIGTLRQAVKIATDVATDPFEFIRLAPLSELRDTDRLGVRAGRIMDQLRSKLRPDLALPGDDDAFVSLRGRFSNPKQLRSLYDNNKWAMVQAIRLAAVGGSLYILYNDSQAVIDRPFDMKVASAAGQWYGSECWQVKDWSKEKCEAVKWFPDSFREAYGIDVTPNSAWVLGFLFRRFLEGGTDLVIEYQSIMRDMANTLEYKKTTG